jgi:hypothetical protein
MPKFGTRGGSTDSVPTSSPFIVIEPGGKNYYRWEVAKHFLQKGLWQTPVNAFRMVGPPEEIPVAERTPDHWKTELFEHILKQPLDQGQQGTYDSDSLKAIRIIQE